MGMWGQIGSGIATQGGADWSIGLSLIGRAVAEGDFNRADEIYKTITESIAAEDIPQFDKMLAQEVPEATRIIGGGQGRQAQSMALQNLQSFVDQNGLDSQARSANEQALGQADQRAQGNRNAIIQSEQRKGMGASGAELAAQLQGQQGSANQARQSSLDIAGQARQRALAALGQQAQIGGQMRGQDIDVEAKNAAAEQARNEFNAKMRYSAQGANNDLQEQDYRNRMAKLGALNKGRGTQAGRYLQSAKQTMGDFSSTGQAINYKHQAAADDLEDMPF